jgi:hypothetical protein
MPGATIGTQMNVGYPGQYSRNGDCVIAAHQVRSTDTTTPNFGDAAVLNFDAAGDVSSAQQSIANSVTPTMTQATGGCFMGVFAREVKTLTSYVPQPGAVAVLAGYSAGQIADIIERGAVTVEIQNPASTAIKKGGPVYLRYSANVGSVLGAFEPAADSGHSIQLTNCFFTTGLTSTDANGNLVAEITILSRNTP